jgi:hypothetical protein
LAALLATNGTCSVLSGTKTAVTDVVPNELHQWHPKNMYLLLLTLNLKMPLLSKSLMKKTITVEVTGSEVPD